jgi:hypothetical protein
MSVAVISLPVLRTMQELGVKSSFKKEIYLILNRQKNKGGGYVNGVHTSSKL